MKYDSSYPCEVCDAPLSPENYSGKCDKMAAVLCDYCVEHPEYDGEKTDFVTCAYCDALIEKSINNQPNPDADDDAAWAALAVDHFADCEWIFSHGHTLDTINTRCTLE